MPKASDAVLMDGVEAPACATAGVSWEALQLAVDGSKLPRSVLLLEDDAIILMDTEEVLRELGVAEVYTATHADEALALIERHAPEFALLDIAPGRVTSFEVAKRLHDAGIRFAFLTGYADRASLPSQFARYPCLIKPHSVDALVAVLSRR